MMFNLNIGSNSCKKKRKYQQSILDSYIYNLDEGVEEVILENFLWHTLDSLALAPQMALKFSYQI